MTKSNLKQHEATLHEMELAVKHIKKAANMTTCALCLRDLALAELLIKNLASVISEIIEEGKKERG